MKISEITRRDIVDAIQVEKINWSGRMDETSFLSRLYDLTNLPSTDSRFGNAEGDIWQHRINNPKAERLCQLYNQYLKNDGFQLVEKTRLSGKPIFIGRFIGVASTPGLNAVKEFVSGIDAGYVAQQITRMEAAVVSDPGLAIGTAKELVETCCKTILDSRGKQIPRNADLAQLVKATSKELALTPDDISEKAAAADTIKRLLSNLATITQGIAELRNQYGTGHGKAANTRGLSSRHAKLAVGAASTLAVFLLETHQSRNEKLERPISFNRPSPD